MHIRRVFLLSIGLAAAACNQDGDEVDADDYEDEEVGEATDAFTGFVDQVVVATTNPNTVDVGVSSGTQAFLSSVAGNLEGSNQGVRASIGISGGTLSFILSADPEFGNTQAGRGWAVFTGTTSLAEATCNSDDGGTHSSPLVHPGSGNFACFLTQVNSPSSLPSKPYWGSWSSEALVEHIAGQPHLTCKGYANAKARCIPITATYGTAFLGSPSTNLTWNLGPVDSANGKVCLLTGINGKFRYNAAGSGVAAYINGSNWELFTERNHGARVECVR